jgi:hypothetical protein
MATKKQVMPKYKYSKPILKARKEHGLPWEH